MRSRTTHGTADFVARADDVGRGQLLTARAANGTNREPAALLDQHLEQLRCGCQRRAMSHGSRSLCAREASVHSWRTAVDTYVKAVLECSGECSALSTNLTRDAGAAGAAPITRALSRKSYTRGPIVCARAPRASCVTGTFNTPPRCIGRALLLDRYTVAPRAEPNRPLPEVRSRLHVPPYPWGPGRTHVTHSKVTFPADPDPRI